jgi:hypothetical protein
VGGNPAKNYKRLLKGSIKYKEQIDTYSVNYFQFIGKLFKSKKTDWHACKSWIFCSRRPKICPTIDNKISDDSLLNKLSFDISYAFISKVTKSYVHLMK